MTTLYMYLHHYISQATAKRKLSYQSILSIIIVLNIYSTKYYCSMKGKLQQKMLFDIIIANSIF